MSRFLELLEASDPHNTGDPKWLLVDFLKSKGINVSMVRDTDMLYIDTGNSTIAVTISNQEEDSQQENDMVTDISKDGTDPLNPQAAQVKKQRAALAPKVIKKAQTGIKQLQKDMQKPIANKVV